MGALTDLPLELVDRVVQCSASKSFICFQYLTLSQLPDGRETLTEKLEASHLLGVLRLVCRRLNAVVEPLLFATTVLDFHVCHTTAIASQVASIVARKSPACQYTRTLDLRCLNPVSERRSQHRGMFMSPNAPSDAVVPIAKKMNRIIQSDIILLIGAFQNLHTVTWSITPEDPSTLVFRALASLSQLNSLELHFCDFPQSLTSRTSDLLKITRLRRIVISSLVCKTERVPAAVMDQLLTIIGNNCGLEELLVANGRYPELSLTDILANLKNKDRSPKLKLLSSMGEGLRFPQVTRLDGLRHLATLDLSGAKETCADVWPRLSQAHIHVSGLRAPCMTPELEAYVGSYSGLTTFLIAWQPASVLSPNFYSTILASHKDTLDSLDIYSPFQTELCITPDNVEHLKQYHRLRILGVTLAGEYVREDRGGVAKAFLLAVGHIPTLDQLTMYCSGPTRPYGEILVDAFYRILVEKRVQQVVTDFRIKRPSPASYAFEILLPSPTSRFIPKLTQGYDGPTLSYSQVETTVDTFSTQHDHFVNYPTRRATARPSIAKRVGNWMSRKLRRGVRQVHRLLRVH